MSKKHKPKNKLLKFQLHIVVGTKSGDPHKPVPTIASSEGSKYVLFDEPRKMNSKEMILAQSFPLDYDFGSDKSGKVQYVVGMSVPPLMISNLVTRVYNEWRVLFD